MSGRGSGLCENSVGPKAPCRSRGGFTLLETLLTVLLLVLLTTMIFTGTQAAFRVYAQDMFSSDSQTVSDTIDQALSDALRYATGVTTDSVGRVTAYTNTDYGIRNGMLSVGTETQDAGMIYLNFEGSGSSGNVLLLSDLSYAGLMVVPEDYNPAAGGDIGHFELIYADGVFSGSYRLYDPDKDLLSDAFAFSFRALNA